MANRIRAVDADPERYRLTLRWADGSVTTKHLRSAIARRPIFAALRDPRVFRRVRVLDHGYAIGWARTGVDFAADALWLETHRRKPPFADALMSQADFRHWMRETGFSLSTAADVLGLSRRTIAYYASGAKPVPRVVFLACMALTSSRRRARVAA